VSRSLTPSRIVLERNGVERTVAAAVVEMEVGVRDPEPGSSILPWPDPNQDIPALDTDEDGCTSPDVGWIVYGEPRDRDYAVGVDAKLVKGMWGTPANPAIVPPGYLPNQRPRLARGHLLARQLGGSGDTIANLVTLYQSMNQGPLLRDEDVIRAAIDSCEVVNVSSIPNYQGSGSFPVKSVTITAIGNCGFFLQDTTPNLGE